MSEATERQGADRTRRAIAYFLRFIAVLFIVPLPVVLVAQSMSLGFPAFPLRGLSGLAFLAIPCFFFCGVFFWLADRVARS